MARFVVVEIQDNDEADAFVEAVKNGAVYFARLAGEGEVGFSQPDDWKVPQVYAVPTLFCECATQYKEGRSAKYGWYVCTNCSRPRKGSMQHPFNLQEINVPVQERVYYMGFRADRSGWRIPKAHP